MDKRSWILLAAVVLLIGLGIWYWRFQRPVAKPVETVEEAIEVATEALAGSAIKEATSNPIEGKLPELNPVEKVNPFKYKNPFE